MGIDVSDRVGILDGLRGIAALGVFNIHFFGAYGEKHYYFVSDLAQRLFSTIHSGIFGVPIFFIVSGYLTYGHYVASEKKSTGFLKKRALRLLPVYYLSLLAFFLIPGLGIHIKSILELVENITLIWLREGPNIKLYIPVAWYLAALSQYIMIVAFVMMIRSPVWRKAVYFTILALYCIGCYSSLNNYLPLYTPDNIFCIFLGNLLFMLRGRNPFANIPVILSIFGIILICFLWGNFTTLILGSIGYVGIMATMDVLLFMLLSNLLSGENALRRVLECRPLAALGRISYSFYFFHFLSISCILNFVLGTGSSPWAMGLRYSICLSVSIVVSCTVFFGAEYPLVWTESKKRLNQF